MPHTQFPATEVDERVCLRCGAREYQALVERCHWCKDKVIETGRKVPFAWMPRKNQLKLIKTPRLVGYEVEIDRLDDGIAVDAATKELRGGHTSDLTAGSGLEILTAPAGGDLLYEKIKAFSDKIRAAGAKCGAIVPGGRSGLHTHVDCHDFSWHDLRKFAIIYSKIEPALYSVVAPSRIVNQFCKPYGAGLAEALDDPSKAKEDLIRIIYGQNKSSKSTHFRRPGKEVPGGQRYVGINMHSWVLRGTIECRIHHGTTKWQKMVPFGLILAGMADFAIKASEADIVSLPSGRNGLKKVCADTSICFSSIPMDPTKYDVKKDGVRQWIDNRWEFFAKNRKNPNEPIIMKYAKE